MLNEILMIFIVAFSLLFSLIIDFMKIIFLIKKIKKLLVKNGEIIMILEILPLNVDYLQLQ